MPEDAIAGGKHRHRGSRESPFNFNPAAPHREIERADRLHASKNSHLPISMTIPVKIRFKCQINGVNQSMSTELVTLELPGNMHEQLQALATAEETDVVSYLEKLVTDAYQRERWLKTLDNLYQLIQARGGLQLGDTQEEINERLRQTRQEIFEEEYAHLYR